MINVMVTCEIKLFENYFSIRRRPSEIIFITTLKFAWNYFKIISHAYCSSRIFSHMLIVTEIILK